MRPAWDRIAAAALAATFTLLPGCSTRDPNATPSAGAAPATAKLAPAAPAEKAPVARRPASFDKITAPKDAGVIIGRVLYAGTPPKPKPINFGPEKLCADLSKDKQPLYETLVVDDSGAVKWALVSIRGNVPGKYPVPDKPVVVDQVGCIFIPHVAALMAGQEVEYRNSDPVSHNIRATPKKNPAFNTIFSAKMASKSKLDTPEYGIPLKCDIHFWMSGFVHVLPHPFFAITGDDGSFVISGVPPGTYSLLAWHESLKPQNQSVTVAAGEVREIDFMMPGN
ncbi:MAG: carboxypeptidase regulatory-like domain-containing protein [Isosphaeraceae bacterium]